jgi:PAS domain S-box-containing protein
MGRERVKLSKSSPRGTVTKIKEELELSSAKLAELNKSLIYEVKEIKRAENIMGELEQNLLNILDNSPFGVVILSEDIQNILYANRTYLDILGCDNIEEVLSVPWKERITPDSYAQTMERIEKRRRGQRIPEYSNLEILRENGENRHVILYDRNILWYDRKSFLIFFEDITERVRVEEALRKDEALIVLLLSQIPCRVWTTDTELKFIASSVAELAGLAGVPTPYIGMDIIDYYQTEDADHPAIVAHHQAAKGKSATFEIEQEGVTLDCRVEPLRDMSGDIIGVVGVAFDITDRRNTEVQLSALAARLVEVQEEERRTISRELHDELGQSLTVLQMMLARAAETTHEKFSAGHDEAQALIKDMIARVRKLTLDLGLSTLDDLGLLPTLLEYFKRQSTLTGLNINFKHTGLNKKKLSLAISSTAYRIVQESLTNVIRHAGVDSVRVLAWADYKTLIIRVEDIGVGFNPAKLVVGKTGGLQGIRERVRLLGGKLEIESAPDKGTCLIAELPLHQNEEKQGISE